MQVGDWRVDLLNGGKFRIDGGVVFGVVPRTLWQEVISPDSQNRVLCANHCLLARDGRHTVLVDTGCGTKSDLLDRKYYDLEPGDPLLESLEALGVAPEDIDTVVLSHLHFDHAGGITRFAPRRKPVLVFPEARHLVGRLEWYDATSGAAELQSAYSRNNLLPLEPSGKLVLLDDGQEILPGVTVRVTGGHTRGHLAITFRSRDQGILFPGDLFPTSVHIRRLWCTAYDVNLVETRRRKPLVLAEAADRGWIVVWPHDPYVAASRVERHPKREFVIAEPMPQL